MECMIQTAERRRAGESRMRVWSRPQGPETGLEAGEMSAGDAHWESSVFVAS